MSLGTWEILQFVLSDESLGPWRIQNASPHKRTFLELCHTSVLSRLFSILVFLSSFSLSIVKLLFLELKIAIQGCCEQHKWEGFFGLSISIYRSTWNRFTNRYSLDRLCICLYSLILDFFILMSNHDNYMHMHVGR